MKDRRANMEALIYTKKASAAKLTFIRYLALVIAVMVPVIILSYVSNMMVWSSYSGMQLDYLAPLKYEFRLADAQCDDFHSHWHVFDGADRYAHCRCSTGALVDV